MISVLFLIGFKLFELQILFTHYDGLTLSKPNFRAANKQGTEFFFKLIIEKYR